MRLLQNFIIVALVLQLGACSQQLASIENKGRIFFGKEKLMASLNSDELTVKTGDSLSKIADDHNIKLDDLVKLNNIKNPSSIVAGQRLKLPNYKLYKVKSGDSLRDISMQSDVEIGTLARMNNMKVQDVLHAGKELKIPVNRMDDGQMQKIKTLDFDTYQAVPTPKVVAKEPEVLKPNQMPTNLAMRNLEEKNRLKKLNEKEQLKSTSAAANTLKVTKKENAGRYIWPHSGKILAKFGSGMGGVKNDGVVIEAREGDEIRTISSGKVVYVGNELKGYGNLVIIKHKNDLLTSYANQERVIVQKDEQVERGQVIGYAGKTGGLSMPQLHFSIRKGKKPVDPEKFLSKV